MEPSAKRGDPVVDQPDHVSSREPLRILIVEDRETDTELIVRELKKHGFDPQWTRVDEEESFLSQLKESYDLITSDAIMPTFSALRVVELLEEHQRDIPCIIISGSIGEEEAVALIRAGASDYLMKDRLGRLGQAIRHVREQQKLRAEHRRAHHALVSLNAQLEQRIADRTVDLERLNCDLANELAERRHMEGLLREHEASLERNVAARTEQLSRSHQRLRRLSAQLTLVEQQERKRLASDLHDYLAQLLVVAQLKVAQLRRSELVAKSGLEIVEAIEQALDQSLTYTRTLVSELSPAVLFRQGVIAALQWLAMQMKQRGLQVTFETEIPSIPLTEQQAVLLYQSVRELLINVSKHARTSTVAIQVKYDSITGLLMSVSDNGCGFHPETIWDTSSGFGLLSVRERLESLGGQFDIYSAPGHGTRGVLTLPTATLPLSAESRPDQISEAGSLPTPVQEKPNAHRILVVDDHDLIRHEVLQILEQIPSLQVVGEATNGEQALSLVDSLQPDLVLMDIQMPTMDGIEATKRIRKQHPQIAVVGMSIHNDDALHERIRGVGAVTSLSKDRLTSQLSDVLTTILNRTPYTAYRPPSDHSETRTAASQKNNMPNINCGSIAVHSGETEHLPPLPKKTEDVQ